MIKRKFHQSVSLLFAFVILLNGCATNSNGDQNLDATQTEPDAGNSQSFSVETNWLETYHEVISQYRDVEERRSRNEEITIDSLGKYVNLHTIMSGLVYTALYDVDGDGVQELIVGCDQSIESDPDVTIVPLDLFTYREGSVVNVFQGVYEGVFSDPEDVFGLKLSFSVHENNIIAVYGSTGTSVAVNQFFEITPTGQANLLEGILLVYPANAEKTTYQHYYNLVDSDYTAPEITEDEYHSIVRKYIDQEIDQHGVELIWEPLM